MFAVGMLGSYITEGVYTVVAPFHPFGGAVDIIVVQQEDGTFKSSPWYVQFGKFLGVLKRREKENIVDISINDVPVDFHMYLDHKGEAYFEQEARADEDTIQSPPSAPSSGDEMAEDVPIRLLAYSKTESGEKLEVLEAKIADAGVEASTSYEIESVNSGIADHRNIEKLNSDSTVWVSDDLVNEARSDIAISIQETSVHLVKGEYGAVDGSKGLQKKEKTTSERLEKASSDPSSSICDAAFNQAIFRHRSGGPYSSLSGGSHLTPDDSKSGLPLEMSEKAANRIGCEENSLAPPSEDVPLPTDACINSKERQLQAREVLGQWSESEASSWQLESHTKVVENTVSLKGDKCVPPLIEVESRKFRKGGFSKQRAPLLSPGDVDSPGQEGFERFDSFRTPSAVEFDDEYSEEDLFKSCLALEELHNYTENDPARSQLEVCDSDFEVVHSGNILSSCDTADVHERERPSVNMDRSLIRGRSEPMAIPWAVNEQRTDLTSSASLPARFYERETAGLEHIYSHSVGWSPLPNMSRPQSDSSVISGGDLNGNVRLVNSQAAEPSFNGSQKDSEGIAGFPNACKSSSVEVDLSLCRHLLSEGMGGEAAAMAFASHKVHAEEFECSGSAIIANDKLVVKIGENYFSWAEAAPYILGIAAFGDKLANNMKGGITVEARGLTKVAGSQTSTLVPSATRWNLWPFSFRRSKVERSPSAASTVPTHASTVPTQALVAAADIAVKSSRNDEFLVRNGYYKQPRKLKERTYVPTSVQLASLKLKDGPNKITFTFTTRFLGKTQVDARIHLWKWNTRIVISDVDGTITKSDVLGQVMPLVGRDWSQSGVTRLFSAIKENGYELLFLSARAISQAYFTRQFLLNLKQDGETLPDGPMCISPDGLIPSLYREVIRRAPHEFKISCLEGIRGLFPSDVNPFYAGFGNRDTDEISYRKVGIPKGKVFIINPKGEVAVNHRVDVKSYTSLHTLVDDMFPPMSSCEQEDFNSWNFWKLPIPDIDDDLNADSPKSTKKSID